MTFLIFSFHVLIIVLSGHSGLVAAVLELCLLGSLEVVCEDTVAVNFVQGEIRILKFCVIMLFKFLGVVWFELFLGLSSVVSLAVST